MMQNAAIDDFLSGYGEEIFTRALLLRNVLLEELPEITEQLDLSSRMLFYGYGQKYSELICVIIPSKKGLKLGFNRGVELPDPAGLLEGTGKISRYVVIRSEADVERPELKALIAAGLELYRKIV
jgi:hypothetical protein